MYTFIREDDWGCYNEKGMFLKGTFDKDGYCKHNKVLCDDGKHHNLMEHNMKWIFFNGEIPEGKVIDHIIPVSNGGTNKLSNLRLVTPKENSNNQKTLENLSKALKGKYTGEKHWCTGKHLSEETKKKISEWRKTNQFGENNPMYGKKLSEKRRNEISKFNSKPVIRILENGEIEYYESAKIAAYKYNLNNSSISMACKGKYSNSHRYKNSEWYYETTTPMQWNELIEEIKRKLFRT